MSALVPVPPDRGYWPGPGATRRLLGTDARAAVEHDASRAAPGPAMDASAGRPGDYYPVAGLTSS